jgi:hypothetical protein
MALTHRVSKQCLKLKRKLCQEKMVVVVGTAHKVGSTWLFNLVKNLGHFEEISKQLPAKLQDNRTLLLDRPESLEYLSSLKGYNIFKSHSYPLPAGSIGKIKYLSIYRDPRDVIISSIFYLSNLDIKRGGWGKEFSRLSEKERIITFIEKGDFCVSRLEEWYHVPYAGRISYERLKENPLAALKKIVAFLKLRINDRTIKEVISRNSFKSRSGRKAGDENKNDILRKGIVGDWKNYFNKDCTYAFKHAKEGRWNRLLIEMGYEQSPDW